MLTMEKWVQLNNHVAGRDKIARLIQYTSKAISESLDKSQLSPGYADIFKSLEYILSTFRKLLRFGKCLDVFYGALKTIHYHDVVLRVTLTISKLSQSLFLFADHFMWLARTGLFKNINVNRWSLMANKYWLLSIIMNLCRDFYEIVRLISLHKASIRANISRPPRMDSFRDFKHLFLPSYALILAHKDIFVDTIKNTCDFFIPSTALGYTNLTSRTVGVMGAISSIAGLIALIDPTAKLVPI